VVGKLMANQASKLGLFIQHAYAHPQVLESLLAWFGDKGGAAILDATNSTHERRAAVLVSSRQLLMVAKPRTASLRFDNLLFCFFYYCFVVLSGTMSGIQSEDSRCVH
jgi:hypothetical protein